MNFPLSFNLLFFLECRPITHGTIRIRSDVWNKPLSICQKMHAGTHAAWLRPGGGRPQFRSPNLGFRGQIFNFYRSDQNPGFHVNVRTRNTVFCLYQFWFDVLCVFFAFLCLLRGEPWSSFCDIQCHSWMDRFHSQSGTLPAWISTWKEFLRPVIPTKSAKGCQEFFASHLTSFWWCTISLIKPCSAHK